MQRVFNFEGKNRSEVVIREVLLGRETDTREGNNGIMDEYRVSANPSMEPEARVAIIGTDKVQRRVISKKKKKNGTYEIRVHHIDFQSISREMRSLYLCTEHRGRSPIDS